MNLSNDFRDLLILFKSYGVEFLVIGGYALAAHGCPRATQDIDLFVNRTDENANRVIDALIEFGHADAKEYKAELSSADVVVRFGNPPNRVDILTTVAGVEFEPAYASRLHVKSGEIEVPVLSREYLVQSKRAAGRLRDLADLQSLGEYKPEPKPQQE